MNSYSTLMSYGLRSQSHTANQILVGCCYRPPISNVQYLNILCENMDRVTEENKDIFLLGMI